MIQHRFHYLRGLGALALFGTLSTLAAACGRSGLDLDDSAGFGGNGGSSGVTSPPSGTSSGALPSSTSSGGQEPCATPIDCKPGDCATAACVSGKCQYKPRDDDGDGHGPTNCDGDDCNDQNPDVFPGHAEDCKDGADNDCNGLADCPDPVCVNVPDCGCKPKPGGENCSNNKDDDCDTKVDCNDVDCLGTPACGCAPQESGKCDNGFDDDCDGQIDCDDSDCFSDKSCSCQAQQEDCSNKQDDDCDLLIDCADPDCAGTFNCKCPPPGSPESCVDGVDNDCDTLVDCADPDCLLSNQCQQCTAELCTDGKDNNCDGKIDCADPACFFSPSCAPTPEVCNNGKDDDNDGKIDCTDPDCANTPICVLKQSNCLSPKLIPQSGTYTGDTTGNIGETKGMCGGDAGEAVFYFVLTAPTKVHVDSFGTSFDSTVYVRTGKCNSGKEIGCDDDGGGSFAGALDFPILYPGTYYVFLDGYTIDPSGGANEGPFVLNITLTPNPPEVCDNGLDDDGDHYVDCADPDCASVGKCKNCANGGPPSAEFGPGSCADGVDNDCDGKADCLDDDCSASDYYVTECCDGIDTNGNGTPDDFNCRCASDNECGGGELCYTHTAFSCGIPCENYFGDVCPFVAAGSYCNANSHQCEF